MDKTNVMRILDQKKIKYNVYTYDGEEFHDGKTIANLLGQDTNQVFKTIVCVSKKTKQYYTCVVPVSSEIDLKLAASAVEEKSLEPIPLNDLTGLTGYIRGGCSPIGMKKAFPVIMDASALQFSTVLFSGGKRGIQVEVNPNELSKVIRIKFAPISTK